MIISKIVATAAASLKNNLNELSVDDSNEYYDIFFQEAHLQIVDLVESNFTSMSMYIWEILRTLLFMTMQQLLRIEAETNKGIRFAYQLKYLISIRGPDGLKKGV